MKRKHEVGGLTEVGPGLYFQYRREKRAHCVGKMARTRKKKEKGWC